MYKQDEHVSDIVYYADAKLLGSFVQMPSCPPFRLSL